MQSITMKGSFWTHLVAFRLLEGIKNFAKTGQNITLDRGFGIAATTVVDTATTETITGSVSATNVSDNAVQQPNVARTTGAEIGLQNVIHMEVDSNDNIVERGATAPT